MAVSANHMAASSESWHGSEDANRPGGQRCPTLSAIQAQLTVKTVVLTDCSIFFNLKVSIEYMLIMEMRPFSNIMSNMLLPVQRLLVLLGL